ncbi:glycoside hydrolase [Dichotomopilus funicola]|uniref:Cellulase n=2 Tax=Chaetomiaceae TaxID=35718 RepID=A0AAN6V1K3_9PEZI|nr:glycoside hydrolase [Dichotomopilus funicola]
MHLSTSALLAILPAMALAQASGTGTTTRYWDCCKPSCAWPGKGSSSPAKTCDKSDSPLNDNGSSKSACDSGGGTAYMCTDQSPWAVSDDLAYGWAAVNIAGSSESQWCCACYELTFTSGPVSGKKMIVQATNTGGDLNGNQFDLAIPGGGVGIFNACTDQWGAPPNGWGDQYGGIHSQSDCDSFPESLKAGCNWRFEWFGGADNPGVTFTEVTCPSELTSKSGCSR